MLEKTISSKLKNKEILIMTHIVMGAPSYEESYRIVETMVKAGVDLMELQIPFTDPLADGSVILSANYEALSGGATVNKCLEFAAKVSRNFPIPFVFMSYYNILFKKGLEKFALEAAQAGIKGCIVGDLPPEEGSSYISEMKKNGIDPVFLITPNTPDERMRMLSESSSGFVYCVARKGITGSVTAFSGQFDSYLSRCRQASGLPLAVGFGVKGKSDVDFLKGKADIAIIGTQSISVYRELGTDGLSRFLKGCQ